MGWKGTMRSVVAAARAADREAQRRQKQDQKTQMIANSTSAVEDWENYVENLVSIHIAMVDMIDWQKIASQPGPREPVLGSGHCDRAEMALTKFKPSVFDFLRGGSAKLRALLEAKIDEAAALDQEQYQDALAAHAKAAAEWEDENEFAKRLLRGEAAAIRQVVEEMQSLSETDLVGTSIEFSFGVDFIHAMVKVHGDDIVPSTRRKQLASGRLSETKMPVGQFNELYQDYVSSVALKTAGDLFHILPLSEVYVSCMVTMLNSQTGYQELTPILSIHFVRDAFMRLNLHGIDPSDAMRNFRHAMKFSKTKGFSAVELLEPVETSAAGR
ncbi:hypothetical protein [Roseibium sp.]|uniref:hypothetical protein n=1 Tax=Roseibium sp. TaxID=1936156 RepID=UPI003264024B